MNCPRCDLINPPSAQRCDCGFDFRLESVQEPYLKQQAEPDDRGGHKRNMALGLLLGRPFQFLFGLIGWSDGQGKRRSS